MHLTLIVKKIAAIFFLSILSFNWLGYRFVFDLLEAKHSRQLEARIDLDNYHEEDLISIKTSISLPYYNNSTTFERVNGEIEINGIQYKYVKRRFFSDSVEVLCIPNITATQIQTAKENFYRQTNDLQTSEQGKKAPAAPAFKNLLSEYCDQLADWDLVLFQPAHLYNPYSSVIIHSFKADTPAQPPDLA